MDEVYADEYKELLVKVVDKPALPIVFNINVGHAMPRCIVPFGVNAVVDAEKQTIRQSDLWIDNTAITGGRQLERTEDAEKAIESMYLETNASTS